MELKLSNEVLLAGSTWIYIDKNVWNITSTFKLSYTIIVRALHLEFLADHEEEKERSDDDDDDDDDICDKNCTIL